MAKTQPTRARHVRRRSTFRRSKSNEGALDRNARWVADSNIGRPPREQRSSQIASSFNAASVFGYIAPFFGVIRRRMAGR